jgi:hypothetical protein
MLTVSVNDNLSLAAVRLAGIRAEVTNTAIARALNRTATTVRASAAREISRELGGAIKVGQVRKAIRQSNARRDSLRAVLEANGRRRIPLSAFRPRQTATGVTFRMGSRSIQVPGAFITRSGAVRMRTPDWRAAMYDQVQRRRNRLKRGDVPDLPIAQLFAPGVPALFVQPRILNAQERLARERFAVEFERQIRFALSKG